MKHVGLNVAADPLFTVSYTGVNGGLVIMVADDPGMHSSQNEQDSRFYAQASKLPMLEPSDSSECKEYVKKAFELSEEYDCPVIVRLTTRIAHSQSIVDTEERIDLELKEYVKNPGKYVMMPAMARKKHVEVEKRMDTLKDYSDSSSFNRIEWGNKDIGIITSGAAYQYAKEAVGNASFLKIGMAYPLPDKLISEFAKGVKTLYIIEELEPFIEKHVKSLGIKVIGKDLLPVTGESTNAAPLAVTAFRVSTVVAGSTVVQSTSTVPCFSPSTTPSGPRITSCIAGGSASMVITTSVP
jgi:indolepyruvate ferredoxin oxidoreductase alpha subunit